MLSSGGGGAPPGWYQDPAGSHSLRWWNGSAWTDQLISPPPPRPAAASPAAAGPPAPFSSAQFSPAPYSPGSHFPTQGPALEQAAETRKLPWAKVAIWVLAAQPLVLGLLVLLVWHDAAHWFSEIRTTLNETPAGVNPVLPQPPGALGSAFVLYFVFVAFTTAWTIVLMVFMYSAATHARNLGLPARLSPIWAVLGWIVPVVNLWFPYWVLRDCLPSRPGERGDLAIRYWLLYVFSFVILVVVIVGRSINPVLGAILLAVAAGYAFLEGHAGSRTIDQINKTHQALTAAMTAAVTAAPGTPTGPPGFH